MPASPVSQLPKIKNQDQLDKQVLQQQFGLKDPKNIGKGQFGRIYLDQNTNGKLITVKIQHISKYRDLELAAV
ncbi:MAG: hypothetical protein EZS28_036970 [Streblomastix strix]|uniref:Protein kinase domain-containing protein n=1 Tax=Streblomastix strix TaxID=222440 RepID=A0A5J4UBB0_9EUKA|nr:MAG: hypothetical protein EZS28_036970 [Streblomastix strix]